MMLDFRKSVAGLLISAGLLGAEEPARDPVVLGAGEPAEDRKSTRLNSSHGLLSRMPSSA